MSTRRCQKRGKCKKMPKRPKIRRTANGSLPNADRAWGQGWIIDCGSTEKQLAYFERCSPDLGVFNPLSWKRPIFGFNWDFWSGKEVLSFALKPPSFDLVYCAIFHLCNMQLCCHHWIKITLSPSDQIDIFTKEKKVESSSKINACRLRVFTAVEFSVSYINYDYSATIANSSMITVQQ